MSKQKQVGRMVSTIASHKGVSKRELARRLGWTETQLFERISGKRKMSVDDLHDIAETLDESMGTFLADPDTLFTQGEGRSVWTDEPAGQLADVA